MKPDITLKITVSDGDKKELGFIVAPNSEYVRVFISMGKNNGNLRAMDFGDILKEDYDNFCLDILNTNKKVFKIKKEPSSERLKKRKRIVK